MRTPPTPCTRPLEKPCSALLLLLFARFLFVCGNELVVVGDLQFARALIMGAAKWIDIPLIIRAIGFLDVSTHQVLIFAGSGGTIGTRLATELLPMLQPGATSARGLRRSIDILDLHASPPFLTRTVSPCALYPIGG